VALAGRSDDEKCVLLGRPRSAEVVKHYLVDNGRMWTDTYFQINVDLFNVQPRKAVI
jgi:hypothetical protein